MSIELRDYQVNVLEEIDGLVEEGEKSFFIRSSMATGKTIMLSAFAEKYKDNRKCLVIGPKECVKAFNKDFTSDFEFYNYEKLYSIYKNDALNEYKKFDEQFLNDYSIIIIDEAHKSGAEKYSEPLVRIKENGNYLFFVGASAHSRRTDQIHTAQDQCDILFDSNLVGDIGLDYCFENDILMEPNFSFCSKKLNDELEYEIHRLERSKMPGFLKRNLIDDLKKVQLTYENYSSLESTMERGLADYKDLDNLKIVLFMNRVENYEDIKNLFSKSFKKIFKDKEVHSYRYFCGDSKRNLDNFLQNDGINIIYTINKMNLSVHHPDLKVCIMYRKTTSAIIYEQQIGRVLFTDQKGSIIDIVDNAHTVVPVNYAGSKSTQNYIIDRNRSYKFRDRIVSEFELNFCRYKDIIALIKRKSYTNISVEYNGETCTINEFIKKYHKVQSDVFYFLSKDIPFNRALEAARTEYYVTIPGRGDYSAASLASKFKLDEDELRADIRYNNFVITEEMKEFFNIEDEDNEDISNQINELIHTMEGVYGKK